jgi:hypothetical protein
MQSSEEWYVKYIDINQTPHRNVDSRRMQSREAAIEHARELQHRYTVRSIVGPTGEAPWEQIK